MKSHDQENIERVKGFYEAVMRRDTNTARNLLDGNIEWIEPKVPGIWWSGTHWGPDGVFREVIEPTFNKLSDFRCEISQYFQVGDYVLATGRFYGRCKATGKELNAATAHAWTLYHGKAMRFEAFHDIDQWLEVLGIAQARPQRMAA